MREFASGLESFSGDSATASPARGRINCVALWTGGWQVRCRYTPLPNFHPLTHAPSFAILDEYGIHSCVGSQGSAVELPGRGQRSVLQFRKLIEGGKFSPHDGFHRKVSESNDYLPQGSH